MKPLTLALQKGAPRQFQSLGWKVPTAGDKRRQFYAINETGKPVIITLEPAKPESYDPSRLAPSVFSCEPFPEAVCVELSPCRLLAPPCYQSPDDLANQQPCHPFFEPWKHVYLETHNQALILEPADDGPLQARLDKWLVAMRAAYKREAAEWRDRIKQTKTATLKQLGFSTKEQRTARLAELRKQLKTIESKDPIDGVPCKGRLKLTLDGVKQGREAIRDAWLQEDWAAKHGEDLREMRHARAFFRAWLESHTGTLGNIIDATSRPTIQRRGVVPPSFGEKYEQVPSFLEACARVRYRARFSDNADSVVYLADCELREELTAQEMDEVAKLRPVAQLAPAVGADHFEHSSNYRQLFWNDGGNKVQANLTKTQATAFSALHNAPGFTLAREEWQQEIYGDEPPNDFRPDKIFAYNDGSKVWDRFVKVDGDRYRLVMEG